MGRKVSIFGVRGAGKTCYVYAMSQVMQAGATFGDTTISLIANDIKQQSRLNRGYAELADHKWPMGSLKTTVYDFKVRLQHQDEYQEIIPSLLIRDYRGGLLQSEEDDDEFFMIRKVENNLDEEYFCGLDSDDEFDKALTLFTNKYKDVI